MASVPSQNQSQAPAPATNPPGPPAPTNGSAPIAKKRPVWPWAAVAVIVTVFIGVVVWIVLAPSAVVRSDDARVMVHYASISPRVAGQVTSVLVDDNQQVQAGQLLVTLDDRDYQTAVQNAQGQLDADRARLLNASITALRQLQVVKQTYAAVPSDQARVDLARANAERYRYLEGTGAGTVQDAQNNVSAWRQAQADLDGAKAGFAAARRQVGALDADSLAAKAVVASDEAKLVQAKLNLSYTRVHAPVDGVVSQRSVQLGDNISAGAALMTVLPLRQLYIEADYREVALRHVRPGQHVRIHVDAYDVDLDGVVAELPPASGAIFAPLPPDNATGNFTKIVQRLPVKILISPGQPLARLLKVGLSVETAIDTHLEDVVGEERRGALASAAP